MRQKLRRHTVAGGGGRNHCGVLWLVAAAIMTAFYVLTMAAVCCGWWLMLQRLGYNENGGALYCGVNTDCCTLLCGGISYCGVMYGGVLSCSTLCGGVSRRGVQSNMLYGGVSCCGVITSYCTAFCGEAVFRVATFYLVEFLRRVVQ
ncbi:16086_t:CDS:1 [Acaulospora morrowiae]|uniref:16086_t:CDS:1 n=1 Tax=Acaulospora morrowiae TaxID=94023 RepID=A0A9N9BPW1_9GLOM|nr:16086_t:CDS:1 [Acaulospora morrowiae]